MADVELACNDLGRWHVVHTRSGTALDSDGPPEYGGSGRSFSATDLLAAALGVCIGTSLDAIAARYGIPLDALRLTVTKTLADRPKRLVALQVRISIAAEVAATTRVRLERAASHCVVHRSLHPDVAVTITFASPADRSP